MLSQGTQKVRDKSGSNGGKEVGKGLGKHGDSTGTRDRDQGVHGLRTRHSRDLRTLV